MPVPHNDPAGNSQVPVKPFIATKSDGRSYSTGDGLTGVPDASSIRLDADLHKALALFLTDRL